MANNTPVTFLSPFTALLAAAVAIPLLLLLYFLKLRRRTLRMASTLLWRRSFEDLQVNVPFQRLRFSLLLLLQFLLLLLLLFALAEPVIKAEVRPAPRIILLIDRSASMNAADADETGHTYELVGLDGALEQAVIDMPFTFWQYRSLSDCPDVPARDASDDALYDWLDDLRDISTTSDQRTEVFRPYYHQNGNPRTRKRQA